MRTNYVPKTGFSEIAHPLARGRSALYTCCVLSEEPACRESRARALLAQLLSFACHLAR